MSKNMIIDTIAAIATPPGKGGVGIVRVSGPQVLVIAKVILKHTLKPRYAHYGNFYDAENHIIDQGVALYFQAPHSFTGEDVLELQAHGGPVVLDLLLKRVMQLGVRLARPGEFSERAFLNDKIDLAQAEAIADLINAESQQAAQSALRSLQGEFSKRIQQLIELLIQLRMFVEAAIDFPDEEIDFLSDGKVAQQLQQILPSLDNILATAKQGQLLQEGMTVVIAGKPNAGKSSLLNQLSGQASAIVTDIPGTTRDVLHEQIQIDGLPLHIIDTAGLRKSDDPIEQEGIRRAEQEIKKADRILLMIDSINKQTLQQELAALPLQLSDQSRLTVIYNKADLTAEPIRYQEETGIPTLYLSAKTGGGIALLREHLKTCMGFQASMEGIFTARRRHLEALAKAKQHILKGQEQLAKYKAGELVAEELLQAQQALTEITGEFHADDLLGRIFADFCIGK